MAIRQIIDEETGQTLDVERECQTCLRAARYEITDPPWVYNKRSKMLHFQTRFEDTLCGKNATGESWLWQL